MEEVCITPVAALAQALVVLEVAAALEVEVLEVAELEEVGSEILNKKIASFSLKLATNL